MLPGFNYNLQNAVGQPNTNFNPYGSPYFGQNDQTTPYIQGVTPHTPYPMTGNMTEGSLYPLESSLATPYLNTTVPTTNSGYKSGGMVRNKNDYHRAGEMLRRQGKGGDTILAHINPLEAALLKGIGGSGTINPATGLPQFGLWTSIRNNLGSVIGSIIGNMILPGIGGPVGGAIGQGIQDKARGKSFGKGAGRGALIAAALPTVASAAGSTLSAAGAQSAGSALSSYGTSNAILPALGFGGNGSGGATAASSQVGNGSGMSTIASNQAGKAAASKAASDVGFMDKLTTNTKNFFTEPGNILHAASAAGTLYTALNQNKEKSPEKLASEAKRYRNAMMLSPEEMRQQEAQMIAEAQMRRRVARQKFLPEDRIGLGDSYYARTSSPEEYAKTGRWINYYDNPGFTGAAIQMKEGGNALLPHMNIEVEEIRGPGLAGYLMGETKGQDDKKDGYLIEDDFVIPADVVADIGDGNNLAGARVLENHFSRYDKNQRNSNPLIKSIIPAKVSDGEYVINAKRVTNMGGGKASNAHKKLYNLIHNIRREKRGGTVKLPPKAKSLSTYMMK